jgi:mannose-6-phosphate isomerase-like protein (cupin superfamily)
MTGLHVDAVVVPGDRAETIRYPADEIRVQAGHGEIQVADYRSTDAEGPPMHRHPWDEVQVVVEGIAEFRIGDADWTGGGPGTVQFLPAGESHSVRIPQGEARLIQVSVGAPYDAFARDVARLFAESAPLERIAEVAARHGVTLG